MMGNNVYVIKFEACIFKLLKIQDVTLSLCILHDITGYPETLSCTILEYIRSTVKFCNIFQSWNFAELQTFKCYMCTNCSNEVGEKDSSLSVPCWFIHISVKQLLLTLIQDILIISIFLHTVYTRVLPW